MSAGGVARLGVRGPDPASGMATIGIFCGRVEQGGGSGGKGLRYEPQRAPLKDYSEELELVTLALIAINEIEDNERF